MTARMPREPRDPVTLLRWRASSRGPALLVAAIFAQVTSGCMSHEYRISGDELRRLATLPPEARGAHVRVDQQLGERRGEALEPGPHLPDPGNVVVHVDAHAGAGGGWRGGPASTGFQGTPPTTGAPGTPPSGFHGTPPTSGGFHGTPPGGFRGTPTGGGGGGGGGSFTLPSGGGGDELGAIVVAIIVGAAIAAVVLAASEGMRFAGDAQLAPEQPLYVKDAWGRERELALGALTPEEAAHAEEATVKDDEVYGLRRLREGPIDRTGATYRFELGGGAFTVGESRASGLASHVQVGGYFTPTVGLVVDLALSGGDIDPSCCVGPLVGPTALRRDALGLELEWTPIGVGPLRLGAFAGGGVALAGPAGARENGPMAIGGARLELELTGHMALTVRGGVSAASLPSGWSSAGAVTGGIAIY